MLVTMAGLLIIFICSGLLVYWISWTVVILHGSDDAIDERLDCDLWWGRKLLAGFRSAMEPPQQLVG
jgi:hypothetical protein